MAQNGYRYSGPLTPYAPVSMRGYAAEYFSGADISIFFDDQYVDEITGFEMQLVEKKVPIYGYASYTPDTFATGARLVTGSFRTNLRSGDYLHEKLYTSIQADITTGQSQLPILSQIPQSDPSLDPAGFKAWVSQQQSVFWNSVQSQIDAGAPVDLSKQPYFINNGFSILIVYGDVDVNDLTRNTGRVRSIDNVQVWSVGQAAGLGPDAIQEMWQFCAADLNANNRSAL